eukprot:scaffold19250_cov145-Isochrysis_galbana.AAC.5
MHRAFHTARAHRAPRVTLGRSKIVLLKAPSAPSSLNPGKAPFFARVTAIHTRSPPAGTCEGPSPRCPPVGTPVNSELMPPRRYM